MQPADLCGSFACRVNSTGFAVQQYLTVDHKMFEPFKDQDIHGGPPVVHIPADKSRSGVPHFLGVFHFFMVSYAHIIC